MHSDTRGRVRIRDDWHGDGPCHFSTPPSRYIEKNYHIMQIRARPATLPAKGSRMATFGISRYLGNKKGVSKPETRSTVTHLHAWRHVSPMEPTIPNPDTRKRDAEKTRVIVIFGELETSLIDCVEN